MANDDRIVTYIDRASKVVLRCRNHPDLRWLTKNISYIGARTIYYFPDDNDEIPECPCSILHLEPLELEDAVDFYLRRGLAHYGLDQSDTELMAYVQLMGLGG